MLFKAAKLKTKFNERVLELVDKRAGQAVPGTAPDSSGKVTPITDLMDALRKSVEAARNPTQRGEAAERQPARKHVYR